MKKLACTLILAVCLLSPAPARAYMVGEDLALLLWDWERREYAEYLYWYTGMAYGTPELPDAPPCPCDPKPQARRPTIQRDIVNKYLKWR